MLYLVNVSIREAKYGNLYQVIQETREREQQSVTPSVRAAPPTAAPAIRCHLVEKQEVR